MTEMSDPTVVITDVVGDWTKILKQTFRKEIAEVVRQVRNGREVAFTLPVNRVLNNDLVLALVERPDEARDDILAALKDVAPEIQARPDLVTVRFSRHFAPVQVKAIRSRHINTFVAVTGLVKKVTEVQPRVVEAAWQCRVCGKIFSTPQKYRKIIEPYQCPVSGCSGRAFLPIVGRSIFRDHQKIRIQDSPEGLRGGEQPANLDVEAIDDLAGPILPGTRVTVHGILRTDAKGDSTTYQKYLDLNAVDIDESSVVDIVLDEEDEAQIKALAADPNIDDLVVRSIAPTIFGADRIKLAIALQLFGGIPKEPPGGTRSRGDIHVLLVGDPGIAKSQILRYAVGLSPRGIFTSGKSSTSAGLTAAAVKDEFGDGKWSLEAGALVLGDMGMVAVDEMDKMTKEDRSALHEAMEQQQISFAKAGIMATLKTRCALLGAANPKATRFDPNIPLGEQIDLPASLMDRFDLIFILEDVPTADLDSNIAEHIMSVHDYGRRCARGEKVVATGIVPPIDKDLFRKYVAYAKKTCFPDMLPDAHAALVNYYLKVRGLAGKNRNAPVPITARALEGLIRLAEAHARLRLAPEITPQDANLAIDLMDACLRQVAYDPETGTFDTDRIARIPKTKRDLMRQVTETVKRLKEAGGSSAVPLDQVYADLEAHGIDRGKAEEIIEQMTGSGGEFFSPRRGYISIA